MTSIREATNSAFLSALLATSLVGRDELVDDLVAQVRARRLVTLTGPGGVGKTRLAAEVGSRLRLELPDGVSVVELAAVGHGAAVPDAIATALGVTGQADVPIIYSIAEALSGRSRLLVIDNCEHVLEEAASAIELILTRSDTVRILATSRQGLSVAGEQLVPVPPLGVDDGMSSPAVSLFVDRARAVNPSFELGRPDTDAALIEICRRLDGLALGIELAAARMVSMTPIDVRDRLDDRFRLLRASGRGEARHQTLRDAVRWSFELLDDVEKRTLLYASAFRGTFDVGALAALLSHTDEITVLQTLESLVRKSLVVADEVRARSRYRLLDTIRQFALDALKETGDLDDVLAMHASVFGEQTLARWESWNGPGYADAVDWLEDEFDNLRAAFRFSADHGDVETAVDISAHAVIMGVPIQLFEPIGWVEEILTPARAAAVPRLPRAYTAAGYCCFVGRPHDAVAHTRAALQLEATADYDPFEPGLSDLMLALATVYTGQLDRYVEITTRLAGMPGSAQAYGITALVDGLQASGRVGEASELVDGALAAARAQGNPYWIAYALWVCGSVYASMDAARARATWSDALDYVRDHRVAFFQGFIARDAARLEVDGPDPSAALAPFASSVEVLQRAGNVTQLGITLATAPLLFERLGQAGTAATVYGAVTAERSGAHHVPELPELGERLRSALGETRFAQCVAAGAGMDINETGDFVRDELERLRGGEATGPSAARGRPAGLSRREVEVLRLLAEGMTTRVIAERLFISPKTADNHIQHVYAKIGVSTRAQAALWAGEQGLV